MACVHPLYAIVPQDARNNNLSKILPLTELGFHSLHDDYQGNIDRFVEESPLMNLQSFKKIKNFDHFIGLYLPCGHCVNCRMSYARNWAFRGLMESKLHEQSCFITLTMNDKKVRYNSGNVDIRDLQLFFKRLRRRLYDKALESWKKVCKEKDIEFKESDVPRPVVRYFACGEYGTLSGRPHYHAILFGYYPDDVDLVQVNAVGDKVYISEELNSCWSDPKTAESYGNIQIGSVSKESIAYVAGYVSKKQEFIANKLDKYLVKPFVTMSRRPGLGYDYFKKYHSDFESDKFRLDDSFVQIPRYFLDKLKLYNPDLFQIIKDNRVKASRESFDNTFRTDRLKVREDIATLRFNKLQRNL